MNTLKLRDDTDTAMVIPIQSEGIAMISMIAEAARDPAVNMDKLERLLQMKEKMLEREARLKFDAAFADMQPHLPVIDEKGNHGGTKSSYAKWEDIIETITPILGEYGFSVRCRIRQESQKVSITGKLSHRDGYFEETTIELPVDTTGQKNPVQAIGSSVSYGQRYVFKAMLGLSSRKSDDDNGDGDAAGGMEYINQAQFDHLMELVDEVGADKARFCKYMKIDGLAKLPASKFKNAVDALNAKKKARA